MASADRLRLRQLKLIVALGEQGTLRRAAIAINATQPTATKMLAEVEDIIGMRMYERGPRGLTANAAGREVLLFATGVMSEFARLIETLEARQSGGVGELVVGANRGMTADVIAQAVVEMKTQRLCLLCRLPVKIDAHLTGFGLLTRRGEPLRGSAAEFAERIREIAHNVAPGH
jgi:hypothetical protein